MNIFTQYIISQTGNKYLAQEQLHQLENNIFANVCLYYPHPEIQRLLRIKVWSCSILVIWPFFFSSLILVVATGYPNNSRNSISVTSSSSFSNVIIEYIYSNSLGLQCMYTSTWLFFTKNWMFWTSWNFTNFNGISFSPFNCCSLMSMSCTYYDNDY